MEGSNEITELLSLKVYPFILNCQCLIVSFILRGWSGSAMVLGKLPVPGRPTNLDKSRARGCGWGLFGHFFSHLSFLFSFSFSLGDGPI